VATNGGSLAANYVVPNTVIQDALGRLPANALASGTTTVNLLNPGELYTLKRMNLVDMRFAKILRFGGTRTNVGLDMFNIFNANPVLSYNQSYSPTTATYLRPTSVLQPRYFKISAQVNF